MKQKEYKTETSKLFEWVDLFYEKELNKISEIWDYLERHFNVNKVEKDKTIYKYSMKEEYIYFFKDWNDKYRVEMRTDKFWMLYLPLEIFYNCYVPILSLTRK